MKVLDVLDQVISQAEFAQIIGVSEARVSQLIAEDVIVRGDTVSAWLLGYCERLRDAAAGRGSMGGGELDLVQEKAKLARAQTEGVELKNSVARGEYAPITLLAEVLAVASQTVVERFEQLPGQLKRVCPDLPDDAREQVMTTIAAARNEWVRATAKLVEQAVVTTPDEDEPIDGADDVVVGA